MQGCPDKAETQSGHVPHNGVINHHQTIVLGFQVKNAMQMTFSFRACSLPNCRAIRYAVLSREIAVLIWN